MKTAEMTVRRAIALIDLWDTETGKRQTKKGRFKVDMVLDWTDVDPGAYRKILDQSVINSTERILPVLWDRYRDRSLHQEVLDLADNLPMENISKKARKEIDDGLNRIRQELAR